MKLRRPTRDTVTLGVQGVIIDDDRRVLLIRHSYRPGWHFPGGGVERGEDLETALRRELEEEAGVILTAPPRLFGLYTHFDNFPGDHIALFVIEGWRQDQIPPPNREIAEQRRFSVDQLPNDVAPGTHRRIEELFSGSPQAKTW